MAYRRSMVARIKLLYQQQQQQFSPSFSHITTSSDREEFSTKTISTNSGIHSRFLIPRNNGGSSLLSGYGSRLMRSTIPASCGLIFHRNLWNWATDDSIAKADSSPAVAVFQGLIDFVHTSTGFPWWASIAAATFLVRFLEIPLLMKRLELVSRNVPEIVRGDSVTTYLQKTYKDADVLTMVGIGVIDLNSWAMLMATLNMAQKKVPSLLTGGTSWFMDLTTPDHSLVLPFLLGLTFWIRMELHPINYIQKPPTSIEHMCCCGQLAFVGAAVSEFPAAMYCYAITSNLFAIVMTHPQVQKSLGIQCPTKKTEAS